MDKRILIVLTSHDDLGGVRKTGYYVSEAAHPWEVFRRAMSLGSGGRCTNAAVWSRPSATGPPRW
jgi:hypothetical protein